MERMVGTSSGGRLSPTWKAWLEPFAVRNCQPFDPPSGDDGDYGQSVRSSGESLSHCVRVAYPRTIRCYLTPPIERRGADSGDLLRRSSLKISVPAFFQGVLYHGPIPLAFQFCFPPCIILRQLPLAGWCSNSIAKIGIKIERGTIFMWIVRQLNIPVAATCFPVR